MKRASGVGKRGSVTGKQPRRSSTNVDTFLNPLTILINASKNARNSLAENDGPPPEEEYCNIWCSLDNLSWNLASLAAPVDPTSDTVTIYDPNNTDPAACPAPSLPTPPDMPTITLPKTRTHMFDPTHVEDFDDASLINNLHEAPLLYLLLRRYAEQHIYTSCR